MRTSPSWLAEDDRRKYRKGDRVLARYKGLMTQQAATVVRRHVDGDYTLSFDPRMNERGEPTEELHVMRVGQEKIRGEQYGGGEIE